MKTLYRAIPVIFAIAILAGCSMDDETATIKLSVGQTGGARAVSLSEVSHTVALSGPSGSRTGYLGPGGGSVMFTVAPGIWTITVTGFYQGQVYATGSATANVSPGRTTDVMVQMTVVYVEPPVEQPTPPAAPFFPIDNRPYLDAQGLIPGIKTDSGPYFSNPNICVYGNEIYVYSEPGASTNIDFDDFIWQWRVGGIDADRSYITRDPTTNGETYIVQTGDVGKEITVTLTHPDYQGIIPLGPMEVYRGLDYANWANFASGTDPAYLMDGHYVLLYDPYLPPSIPLVTVPIGSDINPFNGTFDGNGAKIELNISTSPDFYTGLFAYVGPNGVVKNLHIEGRIDVTPGSADGYYAGFVAGVNEGQIFDVSVNFSSAFQIAAPFVSFIGCIGGIVGENKSVIKNCSVEGYSVWVVNGGTVAPTASAGGIAGANYGDIQYCLVKDTSINSVGGPGSGAGGIAGLNDGSIENCVVFDVTSIEELLSNNAGRIWGIGAATGIANYGGNYIVLGGTVASSDLMGKDGEDVSTLQYLDDTWWTGTAGWESVWDGYDEDKPWYWDSLNNVPKLWFDF